MNKKKILVMCLADPSGNPRPNRIISLCHKKGLTVDVLSYPIFGDLEFSQFYAIKKHQNQAIDDIKRALCKHITWFLPEIGNIKDFINDFASGVAHLEKRFAYADYSIIIVEDLKLLPFAFRIKKNAKIVFDAREYYPLQKENSLYFNFFEKSERQRLCKKYLEKCDAVVTVSNGLKKKYLDEYMVDCNLIRSTPYYDDCVVREHVDDDSIRLVYHGGSNANRNISNMISIVEELPNRFSLDLYLVGNKTGINNIRNSIKSNDRIRVKPPMPFKSIICTLNEYDIGFYYLEPTGFNVKYALPNKLFEFIQARLMLAIGPSPDMKEIVKKYSCGLVSEKFSIQSMVSMLENISHDDITIFKNNSHLAAKELCYEKEGCKFFELFEKLNNSTENS